MNTRITILVALAVGILALPPARAQAPTVSERQKQQMRVEQQTKMELLQDQITALQIQINALQAQAKALQAQLRAAQPSAAAGRAYKIPPFTIPNYQIPNYKIAPFQFPGTPSFQGPTGGFQPPSGQSLKPQVLVPQPYWNIPPCQVTLIKTPR